MPNYESFIKGRLQVKDIIRNSNKLLSMDEAIEFVRTAQGMEKSVILVQGTWDLTHAGHVQHIREATKHADIVLLRLASAKYARTYKSEERPIENYRDMVVGEFENVDAVLVDQTAINPEDIAENAKFLAKLKPDMLALETEDDKFHLKIGAVTYANSFLGASIKPIIMTLKHFNFTTKIINKIQSRTRRV